jgi:hypothetical protein
MKKLICILTLAVSFFSCKKEPGQPELPQVMKEKKHGLTFNITSFTQQVKGMKKGNSVADASLKDFANYFTYIAYDSGGTEVSRLKQDSSGSTTRIRNPFPDLYPAEQFAGEQTFGCIKDSLIAGEYTIVMVASKRLVSISNRGEQTLDYTFEPFNNASFYFNRGLDSWSRAEDTFFKKFTVTVGNSDLQQNTQLDRIVGKAEINIMDSKPGTTYKFLFVNENEAFKFSDEIPFGNTDDVINEQYVGAVEGKANLSYSKFILNTVIPISVIIKVYEGETLSASKTIENVRFYKNKRTILTGNIYSDKSPSSAFSVTVNDEFDEETIDVSF